LDAAEGVGRITGRVTRSPHRPDAHSLGAVRAPSHDRPGQRDDDHRRHGHALAPSASAAEITPRDLTITVTSLGPQGRTCEIDADLYVPAGVTAQAPAPALLATNGFGGTKDNQADLAQGFGEHGYVTLSYTGLGFVDGGRRSASPHRR